MWKKTAFAAAIVIASLISLVFPGDAPFIYDEPSLFLSAYIANLNHSLASTGLAGSIGVKYGPLPTWIYQVILIITNSPASWVLIKALFMISIITGGLFLMARATGLWKWVIPLALTSPYIWYYSRNLWDNVFLLPFSSLAIGSYAYYLSCKSSKALLCAFAMALLMPFIHFMAIPLSVVILMHMGLFTWKQTWKVRTCAVLIVSVILIFHMGYFNYLLFGPDSFRFHTVNKSADYLKGWIFPWLGGRVLSGWGMEYFFGTKYLPHHPAFLVLKSISCMAYLFVFSGMYFAGKMAWKNRKLILLKFRKTDSADVDAITHISLIGLTALLLNTLLCGISNSFFHPHYYNSLWIIYLFFAWLSIDKIVMRKWGIPVVSIYGMSCMAVVVILVMMVHERGGTRGLHYGPTINNQLEIARDIGSKSRKDLIFTVYNLARIPSVHILRKICLKNDDPGRKQGTLIIEFANDDELSGFVQTRIVTESE